MKTIEQRQQVVADLKKARELISSEEAWTKGVYARNAEGLEVSFEADDAVRFCVFGALERATDGVDNRLLDVVAPLGAAFSLGRGRDTLDSFSITDGNDAEDTTHLQVMIAFDFAILMAEDALKEAKND